MSDPWHDAMADDSGESEPSTNGEEERLPCGFKELPESERKDAQEHHPTEPPRPYETDSQNRRLCGAKRRNGQPCRAPAMPNGRCRIHGGKSLCGSASPTFHHGRRSKYTLPPGLQRDYRDALKDPELHSLNDDLAALQARLADLFHELGKTEAPPWGMVVDALVNYEQAMRGRSASNAKRCFTALCKAIRQGADAAKAHEDIWRNVMETIGLKAKVTTSEHRRQVDLKMLVHVDNVITVFNAWLTRIGDIVQRRIEDPGQARLLVYDLSRAVYDLLPGPDVIENE